MATTTQRQTIRIRAKSTLLDGKGGIMQLRIDGKVVGEVEVTATSLTTYAFRVNLPVGAESKLDLVFTNAATKGSASRTLYVDKVQVGSYVMNPGDKGVSYDRGSGTAAFDGRSVLTGRKYLPSNGALRFTVPNIITGTTAAETLTGTAGNDVLDGGAGNDALYGGTGNNTYLFGKGDGRDIIKNTNADSAHQDRLVFKAGVSRADVVCERQFDDLLFRIKSTGDAILVTNGYRGNELQLTAVEFADGSKLDIAELNGLRNQVSGSGIVEGYYGDDILHGMDSNDILVAYEGNDELYGGAGDDQLDGFSGNDRLYGEAGNDILHGGYGDDYLSGGIGNDALAGGAGSDQLDGGAGDDLLDGEEGNDSYLFGIGDGNDTLDDTKGINGLVFKPGITQKDVDISRDMTALVFKIKNTGEKFTVPDWFKNRNKLSSVEFGDGSTLDLASVGDELSTIRGDEKNNAIDSYVFSSQVYGLGGDDIIYGHGYSSQKLYGGAGNDQLYGKWGDDILDGGEGKDFLYGQEGNDTYLFGIGDGSDYISDKYGNNHLRFKSGISAKDVEFFRVEDSVVFRIKQSGDQIQALDLLSASYYHGQLNSVEFADGSKLDLNKVIQEARTTRGNAQDNIINGGAFTNNILLGLAGNDKLIGGFSDDLLDGGTGDDYLEGGRGNDTYLFGRGDGKDSISDTYYDTDATKYIDTLRFKSGINASDIISSRNSDDLVLSIKGSSDQVTISNWFESSQEQWEKVEFIDGGSLDLQSIDYQLRQLKGDELDNQISSSVAADYLYGLGGNDMLSGEAGNDFLSGGTGNDTLLGGSGDDTYYFARGDGQDRIEILEPCVTTLESNNDTLQFAAGIGADDLTYQRQEQDLVIGIRDSQDQITVSNWFLNPAYKFSAIEFSDGSRLDINAIDQELITIRGSTGNDQLQGLETDDVLLGFSGDDQLVGLAGNDLLDGGAGNDALIGGEGDDTYLFGYGDGNDIITLNCVPTGGSDDDVLRFKSGVSPEDVEYFYQQSSISSDGSYVTPGQVFRLKSTGEQITVAYASQLYSGTRLDDIEFADGGSLDAMRIALASASTKGSGEYEFLTGTDYLHDIISAGAGDDVLYGLSGNDLLAGDAGNDKLYGGLGDDTYLFGKGDGSDTLFNQDVSGNDTLRFMDGIQADQLWFQQSEDDLLVSRIGSDDKVTIDGWFANSQDWVTPTGNQLDQIRSGDGKTLLAAQVQNLVAAMSGLTPPAAGETSLSADYHSKLDAVIAANWK